MKETAGLPNWGWGAVILAGLGIGYFVMRSNSSSSTSAQSAQAAQAVQSAPVDANALTASGVNPSGPQIVVLPLASTAPSGSTSSPTPIPTSTSSTPDLNSVSSTGSTPVINNNPTNVTNAPGTPRGRTVNQTVLTIRQKGGSSIQSVKDYDATNPPGVPVRATPGGVQVRFAGYGSQQTATGQAIAGPNNVKENTGSNTWWPVQGGYISSFDVSAVVNNTSIVQS